jgi:hypothetical protein
MLKCDTPLYAPAAVKNSSTPVHMMKQDWKNYFKIEITSVSKNIINTTTHKKNRPTNKPGNFS